MALRQSRRLFIPILCLSLIFGILSSCSYKRKNILFKTAKKIKSSNAIATFDVKGQPIVEKSENYKHRIKVGDRVLIKFLNNYDIGQASSQSATSTANIDGSGEKGYLVNYDSTVTLPLVGRLNIIGLTRLEAAKKLEQEYGKFIINPIVEVNIASLSVTILGEVVMPGKILLDKENTTLVDVIALASGFKDSGKKNRVRIIRKDEIIQVDLRQIESLNSKSIIIQDGDIIYIEPYGVKAQTESLSTLQSITFVLLTVSQLSILAFQLVSITR